MTHVVKRLLLCIGVNPPVFEVDDENETRVLKELETAMAGEAAAVQLPAVFIGGKLFGGLDKVMSSHITGELVPVLKQAGALWL
ncbi:GRXC9 [Linum perenne]